VLISKAIGACQRWRRHGGWRCQRSTYRIRAHYLASDRSRASARTKVQARIFEDLGTSRQQIAEKTVVLEYGKEFHDLLDVERRHQATAAAQVAAP